MRFFPLLIFATLRIFVCAEGLLYTQIGEIHLLEVDPQEYVIRLVKCKPLEKTSDVAKQENAEAAVNGGFFKSSGLPSGIFQISKIRFTPTDRARGAIGWTDERFPLIDRVDSSETYGLLPSFHRENAPLWNEMETILGGTPVLVMDYEIPANFLEESVIDDFLFLPHARTAVGVKEDGKWVFAMIPAPGLVMGEWAEFFKSLKCKYALNLDGGSSSTLYYKGKVVHAKDQEVDVSNVLLICKR